MADGEKACMQGDPSVREEPLCDIPLQEGGRGCAEGALDSDVDRSKFYATCRWSEVKKWRSSDRLPSERLQECEMNVYVKPADFGSNVRSARNQTGRRPSHDDANLE